MTVTITLKAADGSTSQLVLPAPNVTGTDTYADGAANAPAGTLQYPNILSLASATNGLGHNLATRPPWKVAGIDYATGIPNGVALQDPWPGYPTTSTSALAPSFVTQCGGTSHISFSGNTIEISPTANAIISGWDFSLHNGVGLLVQSCTNPTISNNRFGVGSNLVQPLHIITNVNGITIESNEFNGDGLKNSQVGFGLIEANPYGTATIQYNYLHDAFSELMVLGNSPSGTTNYQVQYNLMANAGLGQPQGAHGDWVQIVSASVYAQLISATFTFNTCIQNNTTAKVGSQGFSFNGNSGYFFENCIMTYNTVIAPVQVSGGGVNTFFNADYSWLKGQGIVSNNYCDPTGLVFGIAQWVTIVSGSGGQSDTYTGSGNINMVTGAAMPTEGPIT